MLKILSIAVLFLFGGGFVYFGAVAPMAAISFWGVLNWENVEPAPRSAPTSRCCIRPASS